MKRVVVVLLLLPGCSSGGSFPVEADGPSPRDAAPSDLPAVDTRLPDGPGGYDDGSILPGDKSRLLLRGTVVTPDEVIPRGEVLTNGDRLVCVAVDCSAEPDAVGATVIDTAGIIYPGLIDAHNHINYNYQPVWENPRLYGNHNQWQASAAYEQAVAGPHRDLTDSSGANMLCEAMKYGEIRSLIAGTTTVQGAVLRRCVDTLVRNADLRYHGLGGDPIRTNILGVDTIDDPQSLIDDFSGGDTTAYMLHLSEGIDEVARAEFDDLEEMGLLLSQVKIIHGTALGRAELEKVKQAGMSIIWSPSSNLALYGETNAMDTVVNLGIPVALSPDWTPSGEPNVLDELRVARQLSEQRFGGMWSAKQLVEMVTSRAAEILTFEAQIGRLKPGMRADLLVVAGDRSRPYEALLETRLPQVQLVVVAGKALYGEVDLLAVLAPNAYCETVDICGAGKMVCVKETDSSPDPDLLDQSLGDILTRLQSSYTGVVLPLSTCE